MRGLPSGALQKWKQDPLQEGDVQKCSPNVQILIAKSDLITGKANWFDFAGLH